MKSSSITSTQFSTISQAVIALLENRWALSEEDCLILLSLDLEEKGLLQDLRRGTARCNEQLLQRFYLLVSINEYLRRLYPENPEMRAKWMQLKNAAFQERSPVNFIRENDDLGLQKVCEHLRGRCGR